MPSEKAFTVEPIPKIRRFVFDAGYLGRRRHIVHGLLEVDITEARRIIRVRERDTGEKLSLTAFVIYCLSAAIEQHPHAHAYRDWRNRLIIYKDININSMFEVEVKGHRVPMPHIFHSTNRRSYQELNDELRSVQKEPDIQGDTKSMGLLMLMPAIVRRVIYWVVMRLPQSFRKYSSSVLVTAVGMFGKGGGWAITMPNFTLTIVVGGVSKKPGVVGDEIMIREILDLTVSIDHDIVDGAPAARFVRTFRQLLEDAHGLKELV